jgi:hypothetical protein
VLPDAGRGDLGLLWLLARPVLFQHCPACGTEWSGILTADWKRIGGKIRFGLRGKHWWTYDEVTLDAFGSCPDVRGAADLIWQRMERAGRYMEVEGGHR